MLQKLHVQTYGESESDETFAGGSGGTTAESSGSLVEGLAAGIGLPLTIGIKSVGV